ncbi:MAG TPA: hypothetical protein VIO94_11365 [Phenylobacterium sp.]
MRHLERLRLMRAVTEVRSAQQLAAEAEVGRLSVRRSEAHTKREASSAELDSRQACWSSTVSSSSFDPQMAGYWAREVVAGVADLERANLELRDVEAAAADARVAWRAAIAACETAETLLAGSRRALTQHLDEEALNTAEDLRKTPRGVR